MTQLSVIANEVHEQAVADFKVSERFAYSFIMKVKRIREERLYKELGFSTFDEYCSTAWNTKRDFMDQRIQIADSFGEGNFADTYRQLGHSKSLLLARMEPEIRQKIETSIDVNESTVNQLKEAERSAQQAQQEAERYKSLYEKEKDKPAQVVTQTVEKVPDHIGKQIETLKFENTNLKHGYQSAKEKLQQFELRDTVNFDEEQARKEREKLQHEADLNTINIRIAYKQFIEKAAITAFVQGAIAHANPNEKERLTELVDSAQQIIDQTKLALRGRKLGAV